MRIKLLKLFDKIAGSFLIRLFPSPSIPRKEVFDSFLFIRPGGIGDAVLLIPAINSLKLKYPHADITVLAEKRNGAVFRLSPAVDRIFRYDVPSEMLTALKRSYDVVIDTEQWHRLSAVVGRLTRAPISACFATNHRKKLSIHHIQYSQDDYEADSFINLLAPVGLPPSDCLMPSPPYLVNSEIALEKAESLLADVPGQGPFIVIFPGASIPERRWGAEKFKRVAAHLYHQNFRVVVVGGKDDEREGDIIIGSKYGVNLAGKTSLMETAAVIEKCRFLISGDSGILHLGVGLSKPTISLFGPGIAKKWAPRGEGHIVINRNLPCSPCTRFGSTPHCPTGAQCMTEITVNEVIESVELLLRNDKVTDTP